MELVGTDAIRTEPLATRMSLRLHLMMCRHCTAYVRSLRMLASAARHAVDKVDPDDRRRQAVLDAVHRAARGHGDQKAGPG